MSDGNAKIVRDLTEAATRAKTHDTADGNSVDYILLPNGWTFQTFEEFADYPRRKRLLEKVASMASFVELVNDHKQPESVIFGHPDKLEMFIAKLDYHEKDRGHWNKQIVTLQMAYTPEWNTWKNAEGTRFNQRKLTYFLEDNVSDIADDLMPILERIQNVQMNNTGKKSSAITETSEHRTAEENKVLSAGIPQALNIAIPIYQHTARVMLKARLFVSFEGTYPEFHFHFVNDDRARLMLYEEFAEHIRKETEVKIYT